MDETSDPDLNGRHVLVVEDDALVGMTLTGSLEALGAIVSWASDVGSALAIVETGPPVDLALVDLNLDGTMSTPVIERLVRDGIATVLCTGYDLFSIDARFHMLPRCEKPFTHHKLCLFLNAHLPAIPALPPSCAMPA